MAWSTALTELRTLLNDGAKDKLQYRKKVVGALNGSNTKFKTFEFRRVTDLSTATAPLGVYVNGSAATVSADDLETGEFTLSAAPADGQRIEATYYSQWFYDSEITSFLTDATRWLGMGSDYTVVEDGLKPAAQKYAASEAYQKLALRFARQVTETYRMEDSQDPKLLELVKAYEEAAMDYRKDAEKTRDDFYTRQGQSLAPNFASIPGTVRDIVPSK